MLIREIRLKKNLNKHEKISKKLLVKVCRLKGNRLRFGILHCQNQINGNTH